MGGHQMPDRAFTGNGCRLFRIGEGEFGDAAQMFITLAFRVILETALHQNVGVLCEAADATAVDGVTADDNRLQQ